MGDTPQDTTQSTYQSYQNFKVNVQKMYKHYVTGASTPGDNETPEIPGIDDVRATISASTTSASTTTANLIKSLNISPTSTTPASTANTSTPVQNTQESRCHAFYRIIGFPVVKSDQSDFYNPGLDVIRQYDANGNPIPRTVTLDRKIQVASNVGKDFEAISAAREVYSSGTAQVFSVPQSAEAGVLALTSGTYGKGTYNIRKFNAPFITNTALDPFDFKPADQQYSNPGNINSTFVQSGTDSSPLSLFMDNNGNTPNTGPYPVLLSHSHIIVPFMVDPRIDFSIWASRSNTMQSVSRRIAVPFAPDASFLMAGSSNFADTPYLEKLIVKRYAAFNETQDAGTQTQDIVSYVKSFKTIQTIQIGSVAISDIFSNNIFKLQEQASFKRYLEKMQSLVEALAGAMKTIHSRQGTYYFLPIPSQSGPEGGCSIREVPINEQFNQNGFNLLVKPGDINIIINQLHYFMTNINSGASQANAIPDIAGVTSPAPKFTFDNDTSDSEGDVTSDTKDLLLKIRNGLLSDACDALQTVEMIMGEFSGLGLCDIVAILGALNVMPKEFLLGFLDADAYARAQKVIGEPRAQSALTTSDGTKVNLTSSMTALAQYVSSFYQIMDNLFQNTIGNNGVTT